MVTGFQAVGGDIWPKQTQKTWPGGGPAGVTTSPAQEMPRGIGHYLRFSRSAPTRVPAGGGFGDSAAAQAFAVGGDTRPGLIPPTPHLKVTKMAAWRDATRGGSRGPGWIGVLR